MKPVIRLLIFIVLISISKINYGQKFIVWNLIDTTTTQDTSNFFVARQYFNCIADFRYSFTNDFRCDSSPEVLVNYCNKDFILGRITGLFNLEKYRIRNAEEGIQYFLFDIKQRRLLIQISLRANIADVIYIFDRNFRPVYFLDFDSESLRPQTPSVYQYSLRKNKQLYVRSLYNPMKNLKDPRRYEIDLQKTKFKEFLKYLRYRRRTSSESKFSITKLENNLFISKISLNKCIEQSNN